MKKTFVRILSLLLALVCFVNIFVISIAADEEATASIKGHNIALKDNVYIMYYVEFQNVPAGAEKGVLVWTHPQEEYVYGTQTAILPYDGVQDGYDVYYFTGVSAKMMSQDIYAKAYIKNGNEVTYGKLDKYSVLQYAYNKKGSTTVLNGSTKTLGQLLTSLLEYGATAQEFFDYNTDRLANATYYEIKVKGGVLPDGTTKGLYPEGAEVELTATIENFDHWETSIGAATNSIVVLEEETYTASSVRYSEGLTFTSNGNGTCYVRGIGTCTDTYIIIPPTSPAGDQITSIGYQAFYGCTSLTSVLIPDSVTSIGDSAFADCSSLRIIEIPSSVTSIAKGVFQNCNTLRSITIPFTGATKDGTENTQFGYIFGANNSYVPASLKTVIITGGTSIKAQAFQGCTSLESIIIPNSVTTIGNCAFMTCTSLKSITIPDSVTSLGQSVFSGCSSLTSVTITNRLGSFGNMLFFNCTSLTSITYTGTKAQWNVIGKGNAWNDNTGSYTIHCTDGDIAKQ